jgi:hypothetical protein
MQFDIGMLFVVIGISTYSPNTYYRILIKIFILLENKLHWLIYLSASPIILYIIFY